MKILEVCYGGIDDLTLVYRNFQRDFPENERKTLKHLEDLMLRNQYKLVLAKHKGFDEIVGYALIYKANKNKALWLDYIAIEEKYRNQGYGTMLFNKIIELENEDIMGIFIEVEIPDKKDKECYLDQMKRVQFYERLGAKNLEFNYLLPTNQGGTPLNLYFKPLTKLTILPKEQVKEIILSVFRYIHNDVREREDIFEKFSKEIKDFYL